MDLNQRSSLYGQDINKLRSGFASVIIGNMNILDYMLKALFSGGHILIEGLPGLGKTLMVKTVSNLLNLDFSRIQFTPDLMPADVTGVNILVEGEDRHREFRFEKGPVFTNVLLADEINRATPKTQSALLQVMEEHHVTVFGKDYLLDDIFLAMATQNPIELKGTYPLPEAQLDRFMFKLSIPSPSLDELNDIARLNIEAMGHPALPSPVIGRERIREIREFIKLIPIEDDIYRFASRFIFLTNPANDKSPGITRAHVRYGSSPRGLISLLAASKISAFLDGRFNLAYEDLRDNYLACLRHRIIMNFEAQVQKVRVEDVLRDIFENMPKPH